jgi:hypothetical protein
MDSESKFSIARSLPDPISPSCSSTTNSFGSGEGAYLRQFKRELSFDINIQTLRCQPEYSSKVQTSSIDRNTAIHVLVSALDGRVDYSSLRSSTCVRLVRFDPPISAETSETSEASSLGTGCSQTLFTCNTIMPARLTLSRRILIYCSWFRKATVSI